MSVVTEPKKVKCSHSERRAVKVNGRYLNNAEELQDNDNKFEELGYLDEENEIKQWK